ncbi:hypothetical protein LLG96_06295 [bacterium]|nr:hypothetical protein [bacterium]
MIEKLIENWLDSASERSYQPVFVQILTAQGYRVVHSTRHTGLEFGKDVYAIAPDGSGCVFQLKGNPGGRMGLCEFRRDIQPQLIQLISQPVVFPGFPSDSHKSYLVSNGFFEEEVQRAVDDLNRGRYLSNISLISRGDLIRWCQDLGTSLWPSELDDVRLLLELYLTNPNDVLPTKKLSSLIQKVLKLNSFSNNISSKSEFYRVVTSSALLIGIVTSCFLEIENHFAVVSAWILLAVSIIAAGEKHGFELKGVAIETLILAEKAAGDALVGLWHEVKDRRHLVEGDGLTDNEIYGWRLTILLGLLSCLAIMDEKNHYLDDQNREILTQWLLKRQKDKYLWGEGAVANIVPWLIWRRKHDPTSKVDEDILSLVFTLIARNQPNSNSCLVNPYYSFDEVLRFKNNLDKASTISRESFNGSSYTLEPLFHLLVRTNLKQHCKMLWPDFTKISHRCSLPDNPWEYCTYKFDSGIDISKVYPSTYMWSDLKAEALKSKKDLIPEQLALRPWLLALWWQVAPYRYNTEASKSFIEGYMHEWGV